MLTVAKCETGLMTADVGILFDVDSAPSPKGNGSVLPMSSEEKVSMYVADNVEKMSQQTAREVTQALEQADTLFPNQIVDVRACGAVEVRKNGHSVIVAGWTVTLAVDTDMEATDLGEFFRKAYDAMERMHVASDVVFIVSLDIGKNVLSTLREAMNEFVLIGDAVDGVWTIHAGDARFSPTRPHNNLCIAPPVLKTSEWCFSDLFMFLFK